MKLPILITALQKSWNKDTSYYKDYCEKCSNPAYGQCAVTALVAQDYFGGQIIGCFVEGKRHYFNQIDGQDIDLKIRCQSSDRLGK